MKKLGCYMLAAVMFAQLTLPAAAADEYTISDWAEAEVAEAAALGFLPEGALDGDLTRPITRAVFAEYALYFLAAQYNMELNDFHNAYLPAYNLTFANAPFSDSDDFFVRLAYSIGVVAGYEDGTFRPDAYITRQEAAKLLLNVYDVYGETYGEVPEHGFTDSVSDWAGEAVGVMSAWGVMRGVGGTEFSPAGHYTVEQSVITFLRLYENAPESRRHSNITHFMTFEELLSNTVNAEMFHVYERFDLDDCTIIYGATTGVPHGPFHSLWIIYKTGGRREILNMVPTTVAFRGRRPAYDLTVYDDEGRMTFSYISYDFDEHSGWMYFEVDIATATLTRVD